jgi:hypothetical protein
MPPTLTAAELFDLWLEGFRQIVAHDEVVAHDGELLDEWLRDNRDFMLQRFELAAAVLNARREGAASMKEQARAAELRAREAELDAAHARLGADRAEFRAEQRAQAAEQAADTPEVDASPSERKREVHARLWALFREALARMKSARDADPDLTIQQAIDATFPKQTAESLRRYASGPWFHHYRNAALAERMPSHGRSRGRASADPRRVRVELELDNLDGDDSVRVYARGVDAAQWAASQQTIEGSRWEGVRDGFPYAVVADDPDLLDRLRREHPEVEINTDSYAPPEAVRAESCPRYMRH